MERGRGGRERESGGARARSHRGRASPFLPSSSVEQQTYLSLSLLASSLNNDPALARYSSSP
eukprot:scaffold244342_cov26-Tisochrysis_lutea.AAC.2